MSATFEPREVEKPFRMRWLRMTLQLLLRTPARFSVAILLLGCLDAFVRNSLPGNVISRPWSVRLGMLILPLVWVAIAALARGADNSTQNWKSLTSLTRPTVWMSALAIGLGLVALDMAVRHLFVPGLHSQDVNLLSGRILEFTGAQAWMVMTAAGICFFPLLVLEPGLSLQEVLRLSKSATYINGRKPISWLMIGVLLVAGIMEMYVPAYGLTTATWIVFVGVLNYVAYRDIFERRDANLPETVAITPARASSYNST
jgi:hypothetical protein